MVEITTNVFAVFTFLKSGTATYITGLVKRRILLYCKAATSLSKKLSLIMNSLSFMFKISEISGLSFMTEKKLVDMKDDHLQFFI